MKNAHRLVHFLKTLIGPMTGFSHFSIIRILIFFFLVMRFFFLVKLQRFRSGIFYRYIFKTETSSVQIPCRFICARPGKILHRSQQFPIISQGFLSRFLKGNSCFYLPSFFFLKNFQETFWKVHF